MGPHLTARERFDSDSDFFSGELPLHRGWNQLITTTSEAVRGIPDCHQRSRLLAQPARLGDGPRNDITVKEVQE